MIHGITEHDLSYDKVNLDYEALWRTAVIAYRLSLREIERCSSELRSLNPVVATTRLYLTADRLRKSANDLAVVADTLVALVGGFERSQVVIVNKSLTIHVGFEGTAP